MPRHAASQSRADRQPAHQHLSPEAPLSGPQRAAALDQKLRSLEHAQGPVARHRRRSPRPRHVLVQPRHRGPGDPARHRQDRRAHRRLHARHRPPLPRDARDAGSEPAGIWRRHPRPVPDARDVEELVSRDGIMGFRQSIEARKACCHVRKVLPLNRALAGAAGWVTGLRREQSSERAEVPFASWDAEHNLDQDQPDRRLVPRASRRLHRKERRPHQSAARQGLPVHRLPAVHARHQARRGHPRRPLVVENEDGKECGLHNRPANKGAAA